MTMAERVAVVAGCRYVDEVVEDAPLHVTEEWLTGLRVDLVVHGDDFDADVVERLYGVPIRLGMFRTVPYTPGISTSDLLRRMRARLDLGEDQD
jgi:glycerol-3-phosphate cytidylyltransferase-like family protein